MNNRLKATKYTVINNIMGLLLKWWSEALYSAYTCIYRGKQTFSDIKLTNTLNKWTS